MNNEKYTHIDLSYLYEIADNDNDFVREMISDYIKSVPEQFSQLQSVFAEEDYEQTRFIAHKIKSAFQFMGVEQLIKRAYSIEKESQEKNRLAIANDLEAMKPVVKEVLQELEIQLTKL